MLTGDPVTPKLPGDDLPRPERLALLLSLARPTADEGTAIDNLVQDPMLDWGAVEHLVTLNAIRPWSWQLLIKRGMTRFVPPERATQWAAYAAEITGRNVKRLETATPLFQEAARLGIRIAVLKGIYFAPTYYGPVGYKKMNDIDFLLPLAQLDELLPLLGRHGFFSVGKILEDESQRQYSHHTPPYFHPNLACALGVHWGLISPLTAYRPDYEALWSRVVPFEFLGGTHHALHPVDNVHHLCIHFPYYKRGLRELADLYNLLRATPDFDWALLEKEARKAGTEPLVYHALSLVQALVPIPGAAELLARLAPDVRGFYKADTARRIANPLRLLHARSIHMTTIDQAFVTFTMSDHLPTKLRAYWGMWGSGLLAPRAEVARFHDLDPADPNLTYYYPSMFARVIRHIAKDLGWKIFGIVVVKHQYDLVRCLGRTLIRRNRPDKLAVLAERNGLTTEQITTLRGLME